MTKNKPCKLINLTEFNHVNYQCQQTLCYKHFYYVCLSVINFSPQIKLKMLNLRLFELTQNL